MIYTKEHDVENPPSGPCGCEHACTCYGPGALVPLPLRVLHGPPRGRVCRRLFASLGEHARQDAAQTEEHMSPTARASRSLRRLADLLWGAMEELEEGDTFTSFWRGAALHMEQG